MEPPLFNIALSSRRLKIVFLTPESVLSLFRVKEGIWSAMVNHIELPDGLKVESVHYTYNPAAFAFTISHESFEEVPPGELIPTVTPGWGEPIYKTHSDNIKDVIGMKSESELQELKELVAAELYDRERMVKDKQR